MSMVTKKECGLCFGMEWDEAIYCPQCHGSGKIEEEIPCHIDLMTENVMSPDEDKAEEM